jgi:hypothetical protein
MDTSRLSPAETHVQQLIDRPILAHVKAVRSSCSQQQIMEVVETGLLASRAATPATVKSIRVPLDLESRNQRDAVETSCIMPFTPAPLSLWLKSAENLDAIAMLLRAHTHQTRPGLVKISLDQAQPLVMAQHYFGGGMSVLPTCDAIRQFCPWQLETVSQWPLTGMTLPSGPLASAAQEPRECIMSPIRCD